MGAVGFIAAGWILYALGWTLLRVITSPEHNHEFREPGQFNTSLSAVMGLWIGSLGFAVQGLWILGFG